MSDAMLFLSLVAVWLGINILFLVLRVTIVPRWDLDEPPMGYTPPVRRDRGSFTAPLIPFDPSNRTAVTREQLSALTKAGDRSARHG